MIITELNHLETVSATQEIVGGGNSLSFAMFNKTDLTQYAQSFAMGGKVTVGKGDVHANVNATSMNTSEICQINQTEYVALAM